MVEDISGALGAWPAIATADRSLEGSVLLRAGEVLGDFRVLEEIGRGGMAIVYRATQLSLGREVALKVLPPHLSENPQLIARFEREARSIAALSHPGVIPIYTVGSDGGVHYFAMKLLERSSLAERLANGQRMAPKQAGSMVAAICEAVHYAHDHKIVHRDLKPSNILLDEEERPVVTDFGIAKVLEAEGLTDSGSTLGTTHYMAPEQVLGQDVDRRSDVYSLGVMAFHMLTGRVPFDGETPYAVAVKQVHDAPPSLTRLVPGLPHEIETVVRRAMAKDPAERYESARAFGHSLEGVCRDAPDLLPPLPPLPLVPPVEPSVPPELAPVWDAGAGPEPPPSAPEMEPEWPVGLVPLTDGVVNGGLWISGIAMVFLGLFGLVFSLALYLTHAGGPGGMALAAVPLTLGALLVAVAAARGGSQWASAVLLPAIGDSVRGRWAERGLARILDLLIVSLPSVAAGLLLSYAALYLVSQYLPGSYPARVVAGTVWLPTIVLVNAIYYLRWNAGGRRTVGKRALGLRVVREDGRALGGGQALARLAAEGLIVGVGTVFWGIGLLDYVWALWDPNGRALHDYLSRTVVVKE